jgi:hypothetical protein
MHSWWDEAAGYRTDGFERSCDIAGSPSISEIREGSATPTGATALILIDIDDGSSYRGTDPPWSPITSGWSCSASVANSLSDE